jgi:tetratricopeptide (TPR) repeat protein
MKRAFGKAWILIILFLYQSGGIAQSQIEELKMKLDTVRHDTLRVQLLNALAEEHVYFDQDKIKDLANQALEISEEILYRKGIALSYQNLGTYHRVKGFYEEAIDYYFLALQIMEELGDVYGIGRSYNLIGIIYLNLENYDLSLEYFQKALEINEQQQDLKWIAGNSNNIGMVYERIKEYEKAIDYYFKSLEMNSKLGNTNWIANNYGNIGSVYLLVDNPQSIDYFRKRLRITREQDNLDGMASATYQIGLYYFEQKEFERAEKYLQEAYLLANQVGGLSLLSDITGLISQISAGLNDFKTALRFEKLNKAYEDSLKIESNTEKITRLQLRYQHKKDRQVEAFQNQKMKTVQLLIAVILFFVLIFIFYIYTNQRSRVRQQELEQEQLSLKNKVLQEELGFKNKVLQDNIHYLVSINALFSNTIEKFTSLQESSRPENKKIIREIIGELQSGINDDVWDEFEIRFQQIHSDFYEKLKIQYPDLSPNEKKLCAFVKLNMTSKEIASVTSMSIKSIETARSRLRKKLKIEDPSIGLHEFLENF